MRGGFLIIAVKAKRTGSDCKETTNNRRLKRVVNETLKKYEMRMDVLIDTHHKDENPNTFVVTDKLGEGTFRVRRN